MTRIHPEALVSPDAVIGEGTAVWRNAQIREGARLGRGCVIGQAVYIDYGVVVGDHVKIENASSLHHGVELETGVFIGPHVVFTNDKVPRAINADGSLKSIDDWVLGRTRVCYGAAVGANTVVVTGVTIGRWAMIGAGAVVTKDVPDHALAFGNPARVVAWVSARGVRCATQQQAIQQTAAEQAAPAPAPQVKGAR
jgi:UDP-2-acetamido-3-amino-2,3-dideoxy-glucuronate N-acetyltransferase